MKSTVYGSLEMLWRNFTFVALYVTFSAFKFLNNVSWCLAVDVNNFLLLVGHVVKKENKLRMAWEL